MTHTRSSHRRRKRQCRSVAVATWGPPATPTFDGIRALFINATLKCSPEPSPDPSRPLFGPAAAIAYVPFRDDLPPTDFAHLLHEAVRPNAQGRVLVLSSGGYPDPSHGGGIKLRRGEHQHPAGVLADGRLRDFAQLAGYEFSPWCRGDATRWGGSTVMPYAADVAIEVAGVTVFSGDYIYAGRG